MGVAKVESMTTSAPFAWHSCAMWGTSTQRRYGFVGDSLKNNDTVRSCGRGSEKVRIVSWMANAHRPSGMEMSCPKPDKKIHVHAAFKQPSQRCSCSCDAARLLTLLSGCNNGIPACHLEPLPNCETLSHLQDPLEANQVRRLDDRRADAHLGQHLHMLRASLKIPNDIIYGLMAKKERSF